MTPFALLLTLAAPLAGAASPASPAAPALHAPVMQDARPDGGVDEVPVFVLVRKDDDVVVETRHVADGATLTIERTPENGVVDVVLPPAPGGSGALAMGAMGETIRIACGDGGLQMTRTAEGGRAWEGPHVDLDALRRSRIRVCVTAADGRGWAFVVTDYATVTRDEIGPVIDVFAGKVPLGPTDFVVCTDTVRLATGAPVQGEAKVVRAGHLYVEGAVPGGGTGTFVLDTGGALTAVDRSILPPGTEVSEAQMVQYGQSGRELLRFAPGGAGGAVGGIAGEAELDELRFGGLVFPDVPVAVFDAFPQLFDRPVVGILGLDQLQRAGSVRLEWTPDDATLRLLPASTPHKPPRGGRIDELPFAFVNGHLMVRGEVNDAPLALILDTGSPGLLLDGIAAEAAGVSTDDGAAHDARGLDAKALKLVPGTAGTVRLGGLVLHDVPLRVGALPVFDPMRGRDQRVGLLGNAVLDACAAWEIDFAAGCVRLTSGAEEAGR